MSDSPSRPLGAATSMPEGGTGPGPWYALLDSSGAILEAGRELAARLGLTSAELCGRPLASLVPSELQSALSAAVQAAAAGRAGTELELALVRADGAELPSRLALSPLHDGLSRPASILARVCSGGCQGVSESELTLRAVVASLAEGVLIQDETGAVIDGNAAAERLLGLELATLLDGERFGPGWQAIGEDGTALAPEEHPALQALRSGRRQSGVIGIRRPEGSLAWLSVSSTPLRRPGEATVRGVVSSFSDVTELRERERQLEHTASHDVLTNLPNRRYFFEIASRAFGDAGRKDSVRDAVLCVDLDGFKRVNDILGHAAGDELLAAAATRLSRCIRPGDVAARLAGDEFALLLLDVGSVWNAVRVAQRILESFTEPFRSGGVALDVGASIGIALAPETVCDPDLVINQADVALRRAKASGKARYVVYDAHLDARARENIELEADLRQALQRNEFEVHYQPILDLRRGVVEGAETLLRWRHPQRGMVSPAEFIPVAEDNGTIHPIGEWVLEQSLDQLKAWLAHHPGLHLGINLSPRQLESSQFLTTFARILGISGVPHDAVMLELTETYLMQDVERAARDLRRFASLGVHIAIDDFGTGYSSLKYLQHLPITHLKVDRSFIHRIVRDERNRVLVEAVLLLADKLELQVIAEGVETAEQAAVLKSIGCRWAQGYLYGRPVPAERFGDFLEQEPAAAETGTGD